MSNRLYGALLGLAACSTATSAYAADFVFGEDFEGVPACTADPFAVGATPAAQTGSLGTQHRYFVKVRSCAASGMVTLGAGGAPASWTTTLDPASLTLASGAVGVALFNVAVPTSGDAGLVPFDFAATNNATAYHGGATLDIANEWILHFAPDGTGSDLSLHNFPSTLSIKVGAKIRLISDDTTAYHLIHADGGGGLVHQSTAGVGLGAGEEYDMTITSVTGIPGHIYCHSHAFPPVTTVTIVP
jgi:hypothetical protein